MAVNDSKRYVRRGRGEALFQLGQRLHASLMRWALDSEANEGPPPLASQLGPACDLLLASSTIRKSTGQKDKQIFLKLDQLACSVSLPSEASRRVEIECASAVR